MQCPSCGNRKTNINVERAEYFCGVCNTFYNTRGFITEGPQKTKTRFARVEYDGAVVTVKIDSADTFLNNYKVYLPEFKNPRVLISITIYEEDTK